MQRAASYSRVEADQSKTYALIGSLLLLGLSYVLLLAAPVVSRQLRTFAGGHANLGAIESWLPAACVSGLVLGGGAALLFVLVQIAREAERRPYVCLAPVLAAFSSCVLIGLRAELPLQGVSAEHVAVFALAVSVAGGALVQDPRLMSQITGVLLTLLPPLSLIGVLWANSGKADPAVAMWTLNAQARAFLTMLTVTSFGIAIIAIVGRRGARSYVDPAQSAHEYLFDANWSADEAALRKRGMPGWLLAMLSAAAVGLVFVGFKVALDARSTSTVLEGATGEGTLDALKRLVAMPASAPAATQPQATKPVIEPSAQAIDVKPAAPAAAAPELEARTAALPARPETEPAKPAIEASRPALGAKAEASAKAKLVAPEAARSAPAKAAAAPHVARHHKSSRAANHGARAAAPVAEPAVAKAAAPVKEQPLIKEQPVAAAKPAAIKAAEPVKAERAAKPEPEQKHAAARAPEPEAPAKPKPTKGDESLDELMDNIVKGKGKNVAVGAKDDPIFGL